MQDFELFLFDFDGLLVDTERLHYQAYLRALESFGYLSNHSFVHFQQYAHQNATAWKEALCKENKELNQCWDLLYQEKRKSYLNLLQTGQLELMPGVEKVLLDLERRGAKRCVVTHSVLEHVQLIRAQLPMLNTIPHWITREDYEHPKPHPECYLKAIALFGEPNDRIVGFEDSLRGLQALQATSAFAIWVCPPNHPLLRGVAAMQSPRFGTLLEAYQHKE